jgi:hypothetical protein
VRHATVFVAALCEAAARRDREDLLCAEVARLSTMKGDPRVAALEAKVKWLEAELAEADGQRPKQR